MVNHKIFQFLFFLGCLIFPYGCAFSAPIKRCFRIF
jgi:hypothetical protein